MLKEMGYGVYEEYYTKPLSEIMFYLLQDGCTSVSETVRKPRRSAGCLRGK